jgi:hypothetical protein
VKSVQVSRLLRAITSGVCAGTVYPHLQPSVAWRDPSPQNSKNANAVELGSVFLQYEQRARRPASSGLFGFVASFTNSVISPPLVERCEDFQSTNYATAWRFLSGLGNCAVDRQFSNLTR